MKTERKDCTGCAHYGVCKWVDDYNIVVNQAGYADICGPFTINVECNHYERVKPVCRGDNGKGNALPNSRYMIET